MIRDGSSEDAADLARAEQECFASDAWDRESLASLLAQPDISFRLSFSESEEFVAWAVWGFGEMSIPVGDLPPAERDQAVTSTARGDRLIRVLSLATRPAWRGKGYARQLLTDGLYRGRARGYAGAVLEVRSSNTAAQALYGSQGFQMWARLPFWFREPPENGLIMVKMFF
ncbi:GNAT family N-acetyltransferase [uncultured Mobiluncus sp.]|uniref:GNAT family N-acetyltransferase n=1 Tax=uncultured Mobiluncus sp. TaxID=293425 RepID=UPI00260B33E3|nr:N-acetyltransferase [uncultured Mobiluncus sp.]